MKKAMKYPVLTVFFTIIAFVSVFDIVMPSRDFSEMENRKLRKAPAFSFSALISGNFTDNYEKYQSDQFILRDRWITLKSVAETILLKTENNGVAYGKDGYMFERKTDVDDSRWERNLSYLESFVNSLETGHAVMGIVPSSYQVLKNKLPAGFTALDEESYIDKAYERMSKSRAEAFDILSLFYNHSDDYIYYRTDHHWTYEGAYIAACAYLEKTGRIIPERNILTERNDFLGTYYSKTKKVFAKADTLQLHRVDGIELTVNGIRKEGLHDMDQFLKRDAYAAMLWGNNALTTVRNDSAPKGKLLVIKDSYANSFVPFLCESFSEIDIVDLRYIAGKLKDNVDLDSYDEILVLYSFSNISSDTNMDKLAG